MGERPQQQEIDRSGRGRVDREGKAVAPDAEPKPKSKGNVGPVPEENRPGHHPEQEQDKPTSR